MSEDISLITQNRINNLEETFSNIDTNIDTLNVNVSNVNTNLNNQVTIINNSLTDINTTITNNHNETNTKIDNVNNDLLAIIDSLTKRIQTLESHKHIIQTWSSGTSWYRVWSDGWIEQGGSRGSCGTDNYVTITFHKPFKNTNYCFLETTKASGNAGGNVRSGVMILSMTATDIKLEQDTYADSGGLWYACGY